MLSLDNIRVFLRAVDLGSFSAAGRSIAAGGGRQPSHPQPGADARLPAVQSHDPQDVSDGQGGCSTSIASMWRKRWTGPGERRRQERRAAPAEGDGRSASGSGWLRR